MKKITGEELKQKALKRQINKLLKESSHIEGSKTDKIKGRIAELKTEVTLAKQQAKEAAKLNQIKSKTSTITAKDTSAEKAKQMAQKEEVALMNMVLRKHKEITGKMLDEVKAKELVAKWDKEILFAGSKRKQNKPNTPCLLYTSPSPRDRQKSRMPSSA